MFKQAAFLLVLLSFLISFFAYPHLPAQLPIHWNVYGQVDNQAPKTVVVWLTPVLMLAIFVLFSFLPQFDPKKKQYKLFDKEWRIIKTSIIAFFVYLQVVIFHLSLNPAVRIEPFMFTGLGVLFMVIGNFLSKIRQNYFIGVKLPWTLNNEDNWNKTHRFAAWCFVVAGLISLLEAFFVFQSSVIVLGSLILAVILPIIYSFWLYQKNTN